MIQGIEQPDIIQINSSLRLKKFDGYFDFAFQWYQDEETVRLVDGEYATVYDMEKLHRMYDYLNNHGELYFIEILKLNEYIPIGDVTFWQEDIPIVIGDKRYRNCGIGTLVIRTLIKRAISIGFKTIYVNEIYDYNEVSRALFLRNGFNAYKKTERGSAYRLDLEKYY
ncbi:GNAT family N-acetyltransferase [Anaerocolumna sedimenticola]|nr:GNAT family N-acetyltransferase [Anaerocolumna sedimenticola]